ncbi:winged helix-turn-helix transcriptional regulator [Asticcacaulis machinosus]|uniref:Helix-turn-helix domain-containing protein n=1 Tax=Asticcacaulis machinosus TaxID=2984211 RepID=A0ABT5HF40_9CAUL|nr:helix-turn-helix domain-containing protein [Asticcacaulis machinosus]MDC7674865.1 helix-turn-helix domain-containing protein [Asticcacaulis machinosus]
MSFAIRIIYSFLIASNGSDMIKSASKEVSRTARKTAVKASKAPVRAKTKLPVKAKDPRSRCAVNLALEAVGDSWSLLIIRDLMFKGRKSFQAFLNADEKIATNILTDRLSKLEACGLISRQIDPTDKRKVIYGLTLKGADLAPVLVEFMAWSHKYEMTDTPKELRLEIEKNKSAFATRTIKGLQTLAPIQKPDKAAAKPAAFTDFSDETLSLF